MSEPVEKKYARRLSALQTFVTRAVAAGFVAPSDDEVAGIAAAGADWKYSINSPIANAWSDTIEHLLHQVQFGVDPVAVNDQLPEELRSPSNELPSLPTPLERDPRAALVDELIRWRSGLIAAGVEGAESIKDTTLRNLVKFNHTEADQIRKRIPGPAAHLADAISEIATQSGIWETTSEVIPGGIELPAENTEPASAQPVRSKPATPAVRVSAPSRTPPRHAQSDSASLELGHDAFCEYAYEDSTVTPSRITFRSSNDGLRLSFEPFAVDGKAVIYRVVSGEASTPHKPEAGEIVAVTTGLTVEDLSFPSSAVRMYQVWCHVGRDLDDACLSQPFLLAEGEQVSPVDGFAVTEDEGRVIGEWSVFSGTRAVQVFRIPLGDNTPLSAHNDPRYRICADSANLTGFVDTNAVRGQRYLYRALAEVPVGDASRLSRSSQQEVLVSVVLQTVNDLEVVVSESNDEFDIAWAPVSAGQVYVYRLEAPPKANLQGEEMAEAALDVQGLNLNARIKHPVIADGGKSHMRGVPWSTSWLRAYLVPVTVLNGQARIGITRVTTRALPAVVDAQIVERYHTQIVTFGWPAGAAAVKAFVGTESTAPAEICANNEPHQQISRDQYLRDGGLIFSKTLTANGCVVCLRGVTYSQGNEIGGEITAVRYPGLARIRYWLEFDQARDHATLHMQSEFDLDNPPAIVLINNSYRFPLTPDDGHLVYLTRPEDGNKVPQCVLDRIPREKTNTGWRADLTETVGFIRLFLTQQRSGIRPYALIDPDPRDLWRPPPGAQ